MGWLELRAYHSSSGRRSISDGARRAGDRLRAVSSIAKTCSAVTVARWAGHFAELSRGGSSQNSACTAAMLTASRGPRCSPTGTRGLWPSSIDLEAFESVVAEARRSVWPSASKVRKSLTGFEAARNCSHAASAEGRQRDVVVACVRAWRRDDRRDPGRTQAGGRVLAARSESAVGATHGDDHTRVTMLVKCGALAEVAASSVRRCPRHEDNRA